MNLLKSLVGTAFLACSSPAAAQDTFDDWVDGFRLRALQAGISPTTTDRALRGVAYNASLIELDRNQSEFSKALWDYLDTAVSEARITNGRAAFARMEPHLREVEATYGVDAPIVTAIWGLETAYGAVRGSTDTIDALATLAYEGRRADFFEGQLLALLTILQNEAYVPADLAGSWAGAMGHTQFMPTSYLEYAVDGDGDGRRDIWGDDPADALASTAHYLQSFGWVLGQPWGIEVQLPDAFDYASARRDLVQLPSAWAARRVLDTKGQAVPDHAPASILLPGGHEGAAFMIFPNFKVLERYNTADAYVIAVGHLADRISGGDPFEATWPRSDGALTGAQRRELQQGLRDAGFDPEAIDGRIGPLTINAIRGYQLANGLVPDGYASPQLLERLR